MGVTRPMLLATVLVGCSFPYEVGTTTDGGSCGELPNGAVLACGTCGRVPCVNGTYTGCIEPENQPGAACGTCRKGTYVCRAPGNVECSSVGDERTTGSDLTLMAGPMAIDIDNRAVNRRSQVAASYLAKHDGEITSVQLMLRRSSYACSSTAALPHPDPACGNCVSDGAGAYNCTVVKPVTPGVLTLQIFRGTPDTMVDMAPLATIEKDPTSLPDTALSGSPIEFVAKTPFAVKKGDPLTFVLGIDSTSTGVIVSLMRDRDSTLVAEHKTWTRSVYPAGMWLTTLRSHLVVDVHMLGCF